MRPMPWCFEFEKVSECSRTISSRTRGQEMVILYFASWVRIIWQSSYVYLIMITIVVNLCLSLLALVRSYSIIEKFYKIENTVARIV